MFCAETRLVLAYIFSRYIIIAQENRDKIANSLFDDGCARKAEIYNNKKKVEKTSYQKKHFFNEVDVFLTKREGNFNYLHILTEIFSYLRNEEK